uniref:Uncharacterized protein n=1 Tax=Picocystis salinarum TaxID=88271 RepID=A0A7S3UDG6_9CHLO|mmetsp:Transcript_7220/g.45036  ORF Transcript_7220/g.45036 Transcript_7220/m.45036 type:complete len:970 (-) Transcript_7220:964-3873(-)
MNVLHKLDPFRFERPVGVEADRSELRYVSALHQTAMPLPRQDGSVLSEDVKLLLMSKYGLKVTDSEAEDIVSMAGVPGEKWLDLPKLMAMLWIPWFLREARNAAAKGENHLQGESSLNELVERMLQIMCGSSKILSKEKFCMHLKNIGEVALAENGELVDDMLQMIGQGGGSPIEPDAFVQGLISDVQHWKTIAEDSCTTSFFDVFGTDATCFRNANTPHRFKWTGKQRPKPRIDEEDNDDVESGAESRSTPSQAQSTSTLPDCNFVSPRRPACVQTSSQIDFMNDSFRSLGFIALVFIFYLFNVGVYLSALLVVVNDAQPSCDTFSCVFTVTILNWFLIVGIVCITGLVLLGAAMLINNPRATSKRKCIASVLSSSSLTVIPFVLVQNYRSSGTVRPSLSFVSGDFYFGLMLTCLCLGGLVVLVQIFTFVELIWPAVRTRLGMREPNFQRASRCTKHACTAKVAKMVQNLRVFHSSLEMGTSEFALLANVLVKPISDEDGAGVAKGLNEQDEGRCSTNPPYVAHNVHGSTIASGSQPQVCHSVHRVLFEKDDETDNPTETKHLHNSFETNSTFDSEGHIPSPDVHNVSSFSGISESIGGFSWSWKRAFSKQHWQEEGLWFSANILLGQISQIIMLILFTIALSFATVQVANACTSKRKEVSGQPFALNFVPQAWMIKYSFIPALIVAILIGIYEVICYIPSFQSTILKMRCGLIPSLDDKRFHQNRKSADMIYSVVADMMYMMLGSMALLWFIVTACLFLLFWPLTQTLMLYLIAWGLGLTITVVARMVVQWLCRTHFIKGMYRKHVKADNIKNLSLVCWRMGTGSAGLLVRIGLLLLAVAVYMGRIDVDLLQKDLAIFDGYPRWFQVDLIVHEAHRHPFIERLATLYLYRWAYRGKSGFGNTPSACWRLIFVLTLMPWFVKDRVHALQDPIIAEVDMPVSSSKKLTGWLHRRKQSEGLKGTEELENR